MSLKIVAQLKKTLYKSRNSGSRPLFNGKKDIVSGFFRSWKENSHFIPLKRMFLSQKKWLDSFKKGKIASNLWQKKKSWTNQSISDLKIYYHFFVLNEKKRSGNGLNDHQPLSDMVLYNVRFYWTIAFFLRPFSMTFLK